MKMSVCKSYGDLPLFLNAKLVAQVLGVSISTAYEVMHEPDFPTLRVGSRMVVPKEKFIQWAEETVWRCEMRKQSWTKRDPIKNYFPLPNEIYDLGLSRGAISVYSFPSCSVGRIARPISVCSATGRSARAWACA